MRRTLAAVLLVGIAGCSEPDPPADPAGLAITQQPSAVTAGQPFQVVVAIQDDQGATVANSTAPVTIALASWAGAGTRTLGGTVTRNAVAGVATFNDLTIDRTGTHALIAVSPALDAAESAGITVAAGAAVAHAIDAGDNQVSGANAEVAIKPSVRVVDAFDNGVPGVTVTFAVQSGGGSITGATQVTDPTGIARVGSWTLGASGTNTLTATVDQVLPETRTFTARVSLVSITSVAPALLLPGVSGTVTGSGFSTTLADNVVRLNGAPATVTAATPTSLAFTVPGTLPCQPAHTGQVRVEVLADFASMPHVIQAAKQRSLAAGETLIISAPGEVRCNELTEPGAFYYLSVFNTSRVYNNVGALWELRGAAGGAVSADLSVSAPPRVDMRALVQLPPADPGETLHARILEENIRVLERRAPERRAMRSLRRLQAAPARAAAVGDMRAIRLPNVNANFCENYFELNTRVAYAGTRAVILEDVNNELYGRIDSTYAAIGQEFDNVMFNTLTTYFGDPLATDATTDNDGKVVMVFSTRFNSSFPGLAGFVVSCDYFARGATSNLSSNFGEYFYARAPTQAGSLGGTNNTPPNWAWQMRTVIIHEVKHITSFSTRIMAAAPFETFWLEESSARLSEELFDRTHYAFAQGQNLGYGSAADPRGPWCSIRACGGRPRGAVRVFEDLNLNWYRMPHAFSPIGRSGGTDFTFYNTAWSLLRWSVDHASSAEADFIRALVRGPETGLANLEARSGRAWDDLLPEWVLAMVLDDYPGVAFPNGRLSQPSWNFRNVMQGLATDYSGTYLFWPFAPPAQAFGAFSVVGQTVAGTAAFVSVGGTPTASQLIELKAGFDASDAPAELRLAIVRIH
jgi:hypothetical protein